MIIETLIEKINTFKKANGTKQSWRKDEPPIYENEYIRLMRIDSSDLHGGVRIPRGKQWSILIEERKNFQALNGWIELKNVLGKTLKVTPFRSDKSNWVGIRIYEMELDPTDEIVIDILDFIFK